MTPTQSKAAVNAFRLSPNGPQPVVVPAFQSFHATTGSFARSDAGLPAEGRTGRAEAGGEHSAGLLDECLTDGPRAKARYSVLLADDHAVVRQTLKKLLTQQADLHLAGESDNGLEILCLVKQLQPDLLVTDLMMPDMNGLEVARRVRLSFPATRIVVVSINGDEPYVAGAFRCGANAFVLKPSCGRHLIPAIRAVLAGDRYVSPPLAEPVL